MSELVADTCPAPLVDSAAAVLRKVADRLRSTGRRLREGELLTVPLRLCHMIVSGVDGVDEGGKCVTHVVDAGSRRPSLPRNAMATLLFEQAAAAHAEGDRAGCTRLLTHAIAVLPGDADRRDAVFPPGVVHNLENHRSYALLADLEAEWAPARSKAWYRRALERSAAFEAHELGTTPYALAAVPASEMFALATRILECNQSAIFDVDPHGCPGAIWEPTSDGVVVRARGPRALETMMRQYSAVAKHGIEVLSRLAAETVLRHRTEPFQLLLATRDTRRLNLCNTYLGDIPDSSKRFELRFRGADKILSALLLQLTEALAHGASLESLGMDSLGTTHGGAPERSFASDAAPMISGTGWSAESRDGKTDQRDEALRSVRGDPERADANAMSLRPDVIDESAVFRLRKARQSLPPIPPTLRQPE